MFYCFPLWHPCNTDVFKTTVKEICNSNCKSETGEMFQFIIIRKTNRLSRDQIRPILTSIKNQKCNIAKYQNIKLVLWSSRGTVKGPTWHWGQAWWSSGRTRQSSGWGRLRAGLRLSLRAFSSAVSRDCKQCSQAGKRQKTEGKLWTFKIFKFNFMQNFHKNFRPTLILKSMHLGVF